MRPSSDVDNRLRDGWSSLWWHCLPTSTAHPEVAEVLSCPIPVSSLQGSARSSHSVTDSVRTVWRRLGHVHERDQRRLVQHQGSNPARIKNRRDQRDGRSVGMANDRERHACESQHWFNKADFLSQSDLTIRVPVRTLASTVRV